MSLKAAGVDQSVNHHARMKVKTPKMWIVYKIIQRKLKAKISKTEKEPKRRLENHSQKNHVAVERPKSEVVKKQQPKKTEPADQKDIAKLQSPEKMVFVIPDSSKNVKKKRESTKIGYYR